MSRPPWWTDADRAELDALVAELVHQVLEHRTGCPACELERRDGWPCPAVSTAIEAVLEWRFRRGLLSRAQWLRAQQKEAA
jgi:hypothetical protein